MRAEMRALTAVLTVLLAGVAQPRDEPPVIRAHRFHAGPVKVFNAAGSVRLIGWNRDSLVVRGRVPRGERFFFGATDTSAKVGIDEHMDDSDQAPCDLIIYLPKGSTVSVKTVGASIEGQDVSGWFYTVTGAVRLGGVASSLDVLSMSGAVTLEATTPFARARAGSGALTLRGNPEDVDLSTISGGMTIDAPSIAHGQFSTVTGAIAYRGTPATAAILDFSSHAGNVELQMPREASGTFTLSTVSGSIANDLTASRAAAGNHAMRLVLGSGTARVTVRTFKSEIRLWTKR
jgi:hypothetical protein